MSKIKQLSKDTLLYGMGNMVPRLINFIIFPLHTQVFDPEEFGVFTYLMSAVALLNIVYSFGMETSYFRFATKPGADEKRVFNVAFTAVITLSATLSTLFILGAPTLATWAGIPNRAYLIVVLSGILFIDNIVAVPFARLRLERKPLRFSAYRITNVLVLCGLNVYFLFFAYDPAVGMGYAIWANLIANSLYLVFFFSDFVKWRPAIDREIFPDMLRYAYPIMFTGLAGMMNEFFSRLALKNWLPDNFYSGKSSDFALGVFGAAYKFSIVMNLAVQAFRMAGEPFFFSHAHQKDSPQLFARVNHYFIIVCCFLLLAVGINLDTLKYIFLRQDEYWEALGIVPPLLLGYLFLGVYYNLTVWFKITDKTYFGTFITLGGLVLTMLLNLLLIPHYGYMGSAWVTALVYGAMTVACYGFGQKYYPIPYHVGIDLSYVFTTMALVYLVTPITFGETIKDLGFRFAILLAWLAGVATIERGTLKRLRKGDLE